MGEENGVTPASAGTGSRKIFERMKRKKVVFSNRFISY